MQTEKTRILGALVGWRAGAIHLALEAATLTYCGRRPQPFIDTPPRNLKWWRICKTCLAYAGGTGSLAEAR